MMKVCKKVRLLQKDSKGLFIKNDNVVILRSRVVVSVDSVAKTEANYARTGVLYIVDTKKSAAFNKKETKVEQTEIKTED